LVNIVWEWGAAVASVQGTPNFFNIYESNSKDDSAFVQMAQVKGTARSFTRITDYSLPYYYLVQAVISGNSGLSSDISDVTIACEPGSVPNGPSCGVCVEGTYQSGTVCVDCPADFPDTVDVINGAKSLEDCLTKPSDITIMVNASARARDTCPDGALCAFPGTTVESMLLSPGYWRSSWYTENIYVCPTPDYCWGKIFIFLKSRIDQ
jgi:hypothetical protein